MHASAWTARPGLTQRRRRRRNHAARQPQCLGRAHPAAARAALPVRGHTRTTLLGARWPTPSCWPRWSTSAWLTLMVNGPAPHAAAALGPGMVLSTQASTPLEEVAQIFLDDPGVACCGSSSTCSTTGLYPRTGAARRGRRLRSPGADGGRPRQRRPRPRTPRRFSAAARHDRRQPGRLAPPPSLPQAADGTRLLCQGLVEHAPTWDDVQWLQSHTRLPVLLKGVLHPQDAL